MRVRLFLLTQAAIWGLVWTAPSLIAQRGGMFQGSANDPAIDYTGGPLSNVVDDLNTKLRDGTARLRFDGRSGYLASVLEALKLSTDSQMLVFSKGSLQARRINPTNPRALFFNDRAALGWVRDGDLLEIAAHDARAGVVFYSLEQKPVDAPQFKRELRCLGCHMAGDTLGVPGFIMFTVDPTRDSEITTFVDHRLPVTSRFGGWFVTGGADSLRHIGNRVPALESRPSAALHSVDGLFDRDGYQATSSDITAHLVFGHQAYMTNLLTRAGWEARAADPTLHPGSVADPGELQRVAAVMKGVALEVVDYMLFVDEAPLTTPITARSTFATGFMDAGPRDRKGRSLRELDLTRRLFKYPCSYLIYSPAFDELPAGAKTPIYERLWEVLSGRDRDARYRTALPLPLRQAVVEILRDTKPDLPAYFRVPKA